MRKAVGLVYQKETFGDEIIEIKERSGAFDFEDDRLV